MKINIYHLVSPLFLSWYGSVEQLVFLNKSHEIVYNEQITSPLSRPNSKELTFFTQGMFKSFFLFLIAADLSDVSVGEDFNETDSFTAIRKTARLFCASHIGHTFL